MTKKSLTPVHQEDSDERNDLRKEDILALKSLSNQQRDISKKLTDHISQNELEAIGNKNFRDKWDPMLPDLLIIVKEKKDNLVFNKRAAQIGRLIVVVALGFTTVLGAAYGVSRLIITMGGFDPK
jgi:hypothetical protein